MSGGAITVLVGLIGATAISFLCHKIKSSGLGHEKNEESDDGHDQQLRRAPIRAVIPCAATTTPVQQDTPELADDGCGFKFQYHPNTRHSIMKDQGGKGHYGSLSARNYKALCEFSKVVLGDVTIDKAELLAARQHGLEHWDCFLLRFLRARNFGVQQASEMLHAHISWRSSNGITSCSAQTEDEVLRCDTTAARRFAPVWVAGFSHDCVPFVLRQLGKFDANALLKVTSRDAVVRHHCWEQERLAALVCRKSRETGWLIEQWVTVIDLRGMSLSQVTPNLMSLTRAFAAIGKFSRRRCRSCATA